MTDDRRSIHAIISGRVQGVWFRAWTQQTAQGLGLDGWVRNRSDGTVEAVFSGPAEAVDRMLKAAEHGPTHARVTDIRTQPAEEIPAPGFEKRPTL